MKDESLVTVGIVVDPPALGLQDMLAGLSWELGSRYSDYEIVVVLQGPSRQAIYRKEYDEVLAAVPCVRLIHLAFPVPPDVARSAILENAIGDFVVLMDPARDPVELIGLAVDECRTGQDVIVGVSSDRMPLSYRLTRAMAKPVLSAIDYQLPANATDFRCVSRRAINAVIGTGRFHHQFALRLQKTGYPSKSMAYRPSAPMPQNGSLPGALRRFIRLLVFNSSKPLRWMAGLGLFGSFIALVFAVFYVAIRLLKHGVVEGWTTTILFMSTQFMLIFVILAFIAEYLGRLLDEQRGSADYSVVVERKSDAMVNEDRLNVHLDPVLTGSAAAAE